MIGRKEFYIEEYCFEEFIKESQIEKKVESIAKELMKEYKDKNPIFVCVLDGAFIFLADLIRKFGFNCRVHFVKLSSYKGLRSQGPPEIKLPILFNVEGEDIIIVEDIIDSGNTLSYFLKLVRELNPASLKLVTLLSKPEALKFPVQVDHIGFEISNDFVIGYGLDYDGRGRQLPSIYRLKS